MIVEICFVLFLTGDKVFKYVQYQIKNVLLYLPLGIVI